MLALKPIGKHRIKGLSVEGSGWGPPAPLPFIVYVGKPL